MTVEVQATTVCKTCGLPKDTEKDFGKNVNAPNGKQASCRRCMGKAMLEGRQRASSSFGRTVKNTARAAKSAKKTATVAKHKTKPTATVVNYADYAIPTSTAPHAAPLFVQVGPYDINLTSVALVDRSLVSSIDVVLNVHDMNRDGHIVARVITLSGVERDTFLASYSIAIGQPPTELLERLTVLERTNADLVLESKRLSNERDAAMQLAEELENKRKKLLAALN